MDRSNFHWTLNVAGKDFVALYQDRLAEGGSAGAISPIVVKALVNAGHVHSALRTRGLCVLSVLW